MNNKPIEESERLKAQGFKKPPASRIEMPKVAANIADGEFVDFKNSLRLIASVEQKHGQSLIGRVIPAKYQTLLDDNQIVTLKPKTI